MVRERDVLVTGETDGRGVGKGMRGGVTRRPGTAARRGDALINFKILKCPVTGALDPGPGARARGPGPPGAQGPGPSPCPSPCPGPRAQFRVQSWEQRGKEGGKEAMYGEM